MKIEKDLIPKMIIAGVMGILIIVCVFILLSFFNKEDSGSGQVPAATVEQEEENEEEEVVEEERVIEYVRMLGLVKAQGDGLMTLYDIENETTVTLTINGATRFEDEYGTPIVQEKIMVGHIVSVKYDKDTYIPEEVKLSPQIQEIKNLSTLTIDETLKTIQIGADIYDYTDEIVALNGAEGLVLSDLSVADDIVVRAYKGKVWSIIVENGHGYIVLENYSAYLDGRLEIGNRTSHTIIKDMRVAVPVGVHQVIITKEDMAPYSASINIEEDQDYVIDLSDLQPQMAQVDFEIVQEDARLFINDVETEITDEPLEMDFGQYNIKVKKDGFMDWEGIVVIDQLYIKQVIDMDVEPLQLHMTGPDGAEFYLDGVLKGYFSGSDPISVPIVAGGHVLTIRKDGFQSWSQSIFVEDIGEDIYYTVTELQALATEEPETEPEEPVDGEDSGTGEGETPGDDTYDD